jgi:hypothetical protein
LRKEHQIELGENESFTEDEDEQASSKSKAGHQLQLTITGAIANVTVFSRGSIKHKNLVDVTADFICQSLQPLSVVDEPSFRSLMHVAEPRFQLPHRTHFTDKVIPGKYFEVRKVIEKQLSELEKCTVTSDLWTAQHQSRSYILLTVHFINNDIQYQSKCQINV